MYFRGRKVTLPSFSSSSFGISFIFVDDFNLLYKFFAGLKAGIKCSGISTAIFFLIFLPIFAARFFIDKASKTPDVNIFSVR